MEHRGRTLHRIVRAPIFRLLCLVGLLSLLSACGTTTIFATHEPMHPVSGYVTLKAEANGYVNRIELRMQRFSIDTATGIETPDTPLMLVKTCNPSSSADSLRCFYEAPWSGNHKMIEFEATAVGWLGATRVEKYKFASGIYGLQDSVGNLKPVPIRAKGDPQGKLDVVLVADPDLLNAMYVSGTNPDGDWDGFRWLLDDV